MTNPAQQFDLFEKAYAEWQVRSAMMPFRHNRDQTIKAFELELDHLVDYLQPVLAAAAKHSTQFDYATVAAEYLTDLDRITVELQAASYTEADKEMYRIYLSESRSLINSMAALYVPLEGHLGFRRSALKAFKFLTDEYGFEVTNATPTSVSFRSAAVFVNLAYSPECPMNSILVGKRTEEASDSGLILDDFAYASGHGILFDYDRFGFNDSACIEEFLSTAASVLHQYVSLLAGDDQAFGLLRSKGKERERVYVEMMERDHSGFH